MKFWNLSYAHLSVSTSGINSTRNPCALKNTYLYQIRYQLWLHINKKIQKQLRFEL